MRFAIPLLAVPKLARTGNPEGPLYGEVVVFTGKLSIDRLEAAKLAAGAGCDVGASVTNRTTMLVVGEQDIRVLKGQDRSSKHRKAESLIAAGASIRIISEQNFRMMVEA
jgi:DNA polymerase-3 subunit epsilon